MLGPNLRAKLASNVARPRPRGPRVSRPQPASARFVAAEKLREQIREMRWQFMAMQDPHHHNRSF
jgi:hypothetical protein